MAWLPHRSTRFLRPHGTTTRVSCLMTRSSSSSDSAMTGNGSLKNGRIALILPGMATEVFDKRGRRSLTLLPTKSTQTTVTQGLAVTRTEARLNVVAMIHMRGKISGHPTQCLTQRRRENLKGRLPLGHSKNKRQSTLLPYQRTKIQSGNA